MTKNHKLKKRIISIIASVVMAFTMLPQMSLTAFAEEASQTVSVCDCIAKCTEANANCTLCREDFRGCTYEEMPSTPAKISVDFMNYLEDPMAVMFQNEEDIDLHDWLVNAYGIPFDIPFTCQPARVAYGAYADGDTIPVTITAGEGYGGSCTVNAEVRYLNPLITTRVLTVTFQIYQGAQKVAEKSFSPSIDFNDYGYDYAKSWNVTLQGDTEYQLVVSWGGPLYEGYGAISAQVVEMAAAGTFCDPADINIKNLSVTNKTGMNKLGQTGNASCTIKSEGFGAYAMNIALDRGDGGTTNKFKINLTFQSSGKEGDARSTVPQGTNVPLTASTQFMEYYYTFSWTKNGTRIDGATGKTYTVPQANPGDVYVATIRRKPNESIGCTGNESWTHTFTVSNETFSGPTAIGGLVYDGTKQKLFNDGVAPQGYNVYYYIPADSFVRVGYPYEDFLDEQNQYGLKYYGDAGTYTIHYFIANSGLYGFTMDGSEFQCLEQGSIKCTIAQAAPVLNTAPVAVTGLSYNGESHSLVTAGSATNGTLQYRLSGGEWSNAIPTVTDAGTYTVEYRIVGKDKNYKTLQSDEYKVTVDVAVAEKSSFHVTLDQREFTYDGTAKEPTIVVIFNGKSLNGEQYTVTYQNNIDAETASVLVTSPNWDGAIKETFTIHPKELTNLLIVNADKSYDGSKSASDAYVACEGVVEQDQGKVQISADISYADANAGENKAVVASQLQITGEKSGNYYIPDTIVHVTATGTISPLAITVTADNKSKLYGVTTDPALTWSTEQEWVKDELTGISLSRMEGNIAGDYSITVHVIEGVNPNYTITPQNGIFTIKPAPITVIAVEDQSKIYGETDPVFAYTITVGQLYGQDKLTGALGREAGEGVGEYSYTLGTLANPNYTITLDTTNKFTITKATPDVSNVTASIAPNETAVNMLTLTGASVEGSYLITSPDVLVWGDNAVEFIFTPADSDNYAVATGTVRITVTDTIAPTGVVTMKENSWTEFLNAITFHQFFKETVDVTVEIQDELSGIKSVEYIESNTALTLDDVKSATGWTMMTNNKVSVTAEDTKQFVYYVRITDNAGNVTYISTDGATFDTQVPVISGITNGATYYTTQKFTVVDANLDTVTVNSVPVEEDVLAGNTDKEYVVVATDKAGNSTTVTVTMKTIDSISETIKELTENNVTGDEAETIQAVEDILAAVDTTNATQAEKDALADAQANVEKLQQVIKDTEDEVKALEDTLTGYDKETVKTTDEAAIDKLIDDLTEVQDDSNLTDRQKDRIQQAIDKAEELLEKIIEDQEKLDDALTSVPDIDTDNLTDDDIDNLENAKDALEELLEDENYTPEEKADIQEKLDEIKAIAEDIGKTYRIVRGANDHWTDGSSSTLSFTANGELRLFKEVRVDGRVIAKDVDYTVRSGSTIVTLNKSYLDTLSVGEHKLEVVYDVLGTEYIADCKFTIKAKPVVNVPDSNSGADRNIPNTSDPADPLGWMTVMLSSMAAMAVVIRKKRETEL